MQVMVVPYTGIGKMIKFVNCVTKKLIYTLWWSICKKVSVKDIFYFFTLSLWSHAESTYLQMNQIRDPLPPCTHFNKKVTSIKQLIYAFGQTPPPSLSAYVFYGCPFYVTINAAKSHNFSDMKVVFIVLDDCYFCYHRTLLFLSYLYT